LSLALSLGAQTSFGLGDRPHPPSSWIRVAVIQGAQELSLRIKGEYTIETTQTREMIGTGKHLQEVSVKPSISGVVIGLEHYKVFGVRILAERTKAIQVNGRTYRGLVEILREQDQTLTVVNRVGIEEYIYGVLRHEVAPWWPAEAMKAQAVVVRTYAVYQKMIRAGEDYDVTGDVLSQVYGGAKGETRRIRSIARSTWGEVLQWKGEIFPTYYSSTCGGHTEDSREVWGDDLPPLRGGPCDTCTLSKHYIWEKQIPLELIRKKLRWRKLDIGTIMGIEIFERNRSGRVKKISIIHSKGQSTLKGHDFRMHIGPDLLKSTLFDASIEGDSLSLKGRGWGHGVGMCQWGAYTRARRSDNYRSILDFYYPGSQVTVQETLTFE